MALQQVGIQPDRVTLAGLLLVVMEIAEMHRISISDLAMMLTAADQLNADDDDDLEPDIKIGGGHGPN